MCYTNVYSGISLILAMPLCAWIQSPAGWSEQYKFVSHNPVIGATTFVSRNMVVSCLAK